MHSAFKTWNRPSEPLEVTEMRIHDGVPSHGLVDRGHTYLHALGQYFPWSVPPADAVVLEIGSGLGYVMQAALAQLAPRRVIGLDVAPSMLEKAKARLRRDAVDDPRLSFLLYDGVSVPLRDGSVDYVYSVAALQHVPKAYVYNLLLEIKRILSPSGFCAIHLLGMSHIRDSCVAFAQEVENQLRNRDVHWHHYYAFDELFYVLADGVGAKDIDIVADEASICASFANRGATFHRPELADETHLRRFAATAALRREAETLRQENTEIRRKCRDAEALATELQQRKVFRYTKPLRDVYGLLLGWYRGVPR